MNDEYINKLIERDTVRQPVRDLNTKDYIRCPVCDWELIYRMEQFCPDCGQRFVGKSGGG